MTQTIMSQVFLDKAFKKIAWKTIYEYYKKADVRWNFRTEDGENFYRLPTLQEVKDDLINAVKFVFARNLASMDYGNWVIYWTDHITAEQMGMEGAQLEVLFVLTGALINNQEEVESSQIADRSIEDNLKMALSNEDYELAARLRDQLNKTQVKQKQIS